MHREEWKQKKNVKHLWINKFWEGKYVALNIHIKNEEQLKISTITNKSSKINKTPTERRINEDMIRY
jgi:hypothetical protein